MFIRDCGGISFLGRAADMGSKKYKGKLCVYCRVAKATDGDHVVCRQFFPDNRRADLPKVPACQACNNAKSALEHYLTTVLPFGAQYEGASQVLEAASARLARNRALHERLANGLRYVHHSRARGPWQMDVTLPLDGAALEKLFEFIVRGLAWHHWQLELDNRYFVRAAFLNEIGRSGFEGLFTGQSKARVAEVLGGGAFRYEAVQAQDDPALTVWRMSLYGLEVGGPAVWERANLIHGLTMPRRWPVAGTLMAMLGA